MAGGRKPKLTKELIRQAAQIVEAGNHDIVAQRMLGVSQEAWYGWLRDARTLRDAGKSGRGLDALRLEFLESIEEAEARAEARNVATWQVAAKKDWRAAAEYLARKHRDRWGRNPETQVSVSGDVVRVILPPGVSPEDG
jgi:hypothetical protein